jgi:hypothetical protein
MRILFLLALMLLSCNVERHNPEINITCLEPQVVYGPMSVMVCHSPSSSSHQTVCSEECFKLGSNGAFCWQMPTEWCGLSPLEPWVEKVCQSVREEVL